MDANGADRLAHAKFGDGHILSCGIYFVTGGCTIFLVSRYPVMSCNRAFDLWRPTSCVIWVIATAISVLVCHNA